MVHSANIVQGVCAQNSAVICIGSFLQVNPAEKNMAIKAGKHQTKGGEAAYQQSLPRILAGWGPGH